MSEATHDLAYSEPEKIKSIDAEFLAGKRFEYQEDASLVEDIDLDASTPGDDINWLEDIELLAGGRHSGRLRSLLELLHQDLLPDPCGTRERARPQGADQAPAVGQLLRHPAQGEALQVPPARARPLGRRLEDGRRRLEATRPRGLGSRRLTRSSRWWGSLGESHHATPDHLASTAGPRSVDQESMLPVASSQRTSPLCARGCRNACCCGAAVRPSLAPTLHRGGTRMRSIARNRVRSVSRCANSVPVSPQNGLNP